MFLVLPSWHICLQPAGTEVAEPAVSPGSSLNGGSWQRQGMCWGARKDEHFQVTRNCSAASAAPVPHPKGSGGTGTPPGLPVSSSSDPFKPSEAPFGVIGLEEGQGDCSRSLATAWSKTHFSQWLCLLSFILSENDIRNCCWF